MLDQACYRLHIYISLTNRACSQTTRPSTRRRRRRSRAGKAARRNGHVTTPLVPATRPMQPSILFFYFIILDPCLTLACMTDHFLKQVPWPAVQFFLFIAFCAGADQAYFLVSLLCFLFSLFSLHHIPPRQSYSGSISVFCLSASSLSYLAVPLLNTLSIQTQSIFFFDSRFTLACSFSEVCLDYLGSLFHVS
jgi:hypothetical protein